MTAVPIVAPLRQLAVDHYWAELCEQRDGQPNRRDNDSSQDSSDERESK